MENIWYINDEPFFLLSGAYHYFRIPNKLWEPSLKKLKKANFNTIFTLIPWIWHEFEEGKFDFEGETIPERDFVGFINIVKKLGYKLIVRPGPYVFGEYTGYGIPFWLRKKYPEILQRNEDGTIHREISVHHPIFMEKVQKWYNAIFKVIKPWIDDGTIIAIQPDNESGELLIAKTNVRDHNPHTKKMFRDWLKEKYSTIENLNKVWKSDFIDFNHVNPPHGWLKPQLIEEFADWHEFLEKYVATYLKTLKNMMRSKGIDIPIFFNDPSFPWSPINSYEKIKETESPVFPDIYAKFFSHPYTFDLPFMPGYTIDLFRNFTLDWPQIITELQCGWFDPSSVVSPQQTIQIAMTCIAHGARGFNWYIIADCLEADRTEYIWKTVLNLEGRKRKKRFKAVKAVNDFTVENKDALLNSKEIIDPIAIVEYLMNNRMVSVEPIDAVHDAVADFSQYGIHGMLLSSGFNPDVLALERVSSEELLKQKVIFLISKGFMDEINFKKLKDYVKSGGTLIVLPEPIETDHNGMPLKGAEKLFLGKTVRESIKLTFKMGLGFLKAGLGFFRWRLFDKRKIKHKESLFVLDSMHILIRAIHHLFKPGIVLNVAKGGKIKGNTLITEFKGPVEPFLTIGNKIVGYNQRYGKGKIILIGTFIGAPFTTWSYYRFTDETLQDYYAFVDLLMKQSGVNRKISGCENVEVVGRTIPDGCLLFIINRGAPKKRHLKILDLKSFNLEKKEKYQLKVLFSSIDSPNKEERVEIDSISKDRISNTGIPLSLESDEVLVIKLD